MHIFWGNIFKFAQFFTSILLGFFLTTFNSFFELLRGPKQGFTAIITLGILLALLTKFLKLMLALD